MIEVNKDKVKEMGELLKHLDLKFNVFPEIKKAGSREEAERTLTLLFYVDAICHQTRKFEGYVDDKHLKGWDYLFACFERKLKEDADFINVDRMRKITGTQLGEILMGSGERYYERAYLLRNAAIILKRDFSGSVMKINEISEGFIKREDGKGMHDLMRRFKAYSDPLGKKIFLFLNFTKKVGFWEIRDPENLWTPVDYHLERVSLRIGLVDIDKKTFDKLSKGKKVPLTFDIKLREKIGGSVKEVSNISRIPIENLDQLFWSLGRSLCLREGPFCDGRDMENCTLKDITGIPCKNKCIFSSRCSAYKDPWRKALKESNIYTIYY